MLGTELVLGFTNPRFRIRFRIRRMVRVSFRVGNIVKM